MKEALIVGTGISGLVCANILEENGIDCRLFEAANGIGGRVRTDRSDGLLLDRGFQVYLTAYPTARELLDLKALRLRPFLPGALIRLNRKFHRISDPFRDPFYAFRSLLSPVGTLADKFRIARMKLALSRRSADAVLHGSARDLSSEEWLRRHGFSKGIIDGFFRPFFGGVFLEKNLETSGCLLEYVFKMFSEGYAAVPDKGMGEISRQLAARLRRSEIRFRSRVRRIFERGIELENGMRIRGRYVVIATDGSETSRLVPGLGGSIRWRSAATVYFEAKESPIEEPILMLNAERRSWVNHLAVLTQAAPGYSEHGTHLIAANIIGKTLDNSAGLAKKAMRELRGWFGPQVKDWKHVRTYVLERALPCCTPEDLRNLLSSASLPEWLMICGDHRMMPSIEGAVISGKSAAERILREEDLEIPIRRKKTAA